MAAPEIAPPAVRRCVADMAEYAGPEEPAALAARLGWPVERIIKLDANENPYGPSPLVAEALSQFAEYQTYPDSEQRQERALLSTYLEVGPEHLMLGNGSDEIIDLLMRAFLDSGDEIMDFPPSFGMYSFNAQHQDARVIAVERDDRFAVRVGAAIAALTPRTKLIFITSPNNPTGNLTSLSDVRRLLETGRVVVLDEAYAEFAAEDGQGFESMIRDVPDHPNLVVLRTFSKWAGLAGLRIGYGVLPVWIAEHLWKLKPPFNVNAAALTAMRESLADREYLLQGVRKLVAERERLQRDLPRTAVVKPHPSRTNFILCDVVGVDGRTLRTDLADRGILTRHYGSPRLSRSLRISIGTPEQNDTLLAALREIAAARVRP